MTTRILHGDVLDVLPSLESGSVDVVVTSPPYWNLRSYLPADHPLKSLELGLETTPKKYVENMVRVFRLVRTVLANHGTCWLNIGDTYSATGKSGGHSGNLNAHSAAGGMDEIRSRRGGHWIPAPDGIGAGNLCLIPQRLAIALQDDGWIVRSVVIWHKPAPMPTSVFGWHWARCRVQSEASARARDKKGEPTGQKPHGDRNGKAFASTATWLDCPGCKKCEPHGGYRLRRGSWRPTSSWEPVLMLAKSADYFCDGEAVKQASAEATISRDHYTRIIDDPDEQFAVKHDHETVCDGANLRDVWTIGSEPLKEKHYAAFPSELVYRCLRAGTSARGYCPTCGKPWVRVLEKTQRPHPNPGSPQRPEVNFKGGGQANGACNLAPETKTLDWWPTCSCTPAEPRPAKVLDPFSGSGRTGIQATRLGCDFIGVELNEVYVEMSERKLREENPLFS